jgi:signal transduction histidine kinase
VQTIAQQHGGSIRAVSPGVGKGTTMLLKLPLSIGDPHAE